MATGIQTGMRKSARNLPPTAPAENLCQRGLRQWRALSVRSRAVLVAGAVLLQVAVLGAACYARTSAYVDLYPAKLQAADIPEISQALLEMGIEHQVSPANDGLKVPRQQRAQARAVLASRNLPLHRVLTPEEFKTDMSLTSSERKALQQRMLEGEITLALRDVEGIQDARVMLAVPEKSYFKDAAPTTASVVLTLQPGRVLDRQKISGLVHLVAFSVPGLAAENVQLTDEHGRDLSSSVPRDGDGSLTIADAQFQVRSAEEKRQQEKLQSALDGIFPGRTRVVVNLDLDFSQAESRLYTPGSAQDDGYVEAASQVMDESLDSGGKDGDKSFSSHKASINRKFREQYIATLTKYARVQRISATVFADGMSAKEAASLEKGVSGSLGIESERGDFVYIDTTPWDHPMAVSPDPAACSPLALDQADRAPIGWRAAVALVAGQALMLVGGLALAMFSRRRQSLPQLEISGQKGLQPAGLVCHAFGKDGRTLLETALTGVHSSELLEGIVRERPNQVADLLRSTWLS
jgi:flagellar biosynthesis/type III secretory pathway M-ring protein FliF/YscJ